jgi:hypothetical protein
VNNEFETIWKEIAMACFNVLSNNLPGGTDKNHGNLSIIQKWLQRCLCPSVVRLALAAFSQVVNSVATVRFTYKLKTWMLPKLPPKLRLPKLVYLPSVVQSVSQLRFGPGTSQF